MKNQRKVHYGVTETWLKADVKEALEGVELKT